MAEKVFAFMATVEDKLLVFAGINSSDTGVKDYSMAPERYKLQTSGTIAFDGHLEGSTPLIPLTDVPSNIYKCRVIGFSFEDFSPVKIADEIFSIRKQLEEQLNNPYTGDYKILEYGPISNGVHILRNVGITEITNIDSKAQAVALCIDDDIYIAYVDDLGNRSAFGVIRKLDKFDGNPDIQFKDDFFEKEVKVIHKTEGSQCLYEITDFESGDLILKIGYNCTNEWITDPIFKFKWISQPFSKKTQYKI